MKLQMKVSSAFRTILGAEDFATLHSVLSPKRKRSRYRIETPIQGSACRREPTLLASARSSSCSSRNVWTRPMCA